MQRKIISLLLILVLLFTLPIYANVGGGGTGENPGSPTGHFDTASSTGYFGTNEAKGQHTQSAGNDNAAVIGGPAGNRTRLRISANPTTIAMLERSGHHGHDIGVSLPHDNLLLDTIDWEVGIPNGEFSQHKDFWLDI